MPEICKGCTRAQHARNTGATPEQYRSNAGAIPEQRRSNTLAARWPHSVQVGRHRASRRGGVSGVRPSSGAASTDCAGAPAFMSVRWRSNIAAPGNVRTPPTPSSAATAPFRMHQIFRCRVMVFRLTERVSCVLACRHEDCIRFTRTVHREFGGRVVRNGWRWARVGRFVFIARAKPTWTSALRSSPLVPRSASAAPGSSACCLCHG